MLLSERLPLAAKLYPDAAALMRRGRVLSYGDLHRLAERTGRALYAEGLRAGDRLALLGDPDPLLVIALYAAVGIGAIPLVPSPLLTVPELAAILEDAEPRLLIYDRKHAAAAKRAARLLSYAPTLLEAEAAAAPPEPGDSPPEPAGASKRRLDDPAVLIYTGGTTGRPKGVMHSHRSMAAWNQLTPAAGFGYDPERRVLVHNLSHLVGQFQLWSAMAAGGCLVFLDEYPADVERVLEAVERDRISHLSTVGQLLRDFTRLAAATGSDTRCLKVVGCGGSVISPESLREAAAQFPDAVVVNNYSQAECGMSISRLFPRGHLDDPERLRSVGRPADLAAQGELAFDVRIVAGDGREAAAGEAGEIVVRGRQTMTGYWRKPEVTKDTLVDGWVRTGDVGRLDADGYLYVLDRLKDMVIVGGSNVYCAEVEQVIAAHEQVVEAAVVGLPLKGEGEALAVCVALREGARLELAALQAFCEPRLARHKWPAELYVMDALPRTAVDKVDKVRLRAMLSASSRRSGHDGSGTSPRTIDRMS